MAFCCCCCCCGAWAKLSSTEDRVDANDFESLDSRSRVLLLLLFFESDVVKVFSRLPGNLSIVEESTLGEDDPGD